MIDPAEIEVVIRMYKHTDIGLPRNLDQLVEARYQNLQEKPCISELQAGTRCKGGDGG